MQTLATLKRISAIVYPVETTISLTTAEWAGVAAEVAAAGMTTDQAGLVPTPSNFSRLKIGRLTAVNSGTADRAVCDALNAPEERKSRFREKHDRWAIPVGSKALPAAESPEDNNRFPEALQREVEDRLRRKYNTLDLEVVR